MTLTEQLRRLQIIRQLPIAGFCWLMLCLSAEALLDQPLVFQILLCGFFILALTRPVWALAALFLLMPWLGGSQPGYEHTVRFWVLLSGLSLGLGLRLILENFVGNVDGRKLIDTANPMVFAFFVYWLVAGFSLMFVVPGDSLFRLLTFDPLAARHFLGQYENSPYYPWLSFISLTITLFLFLYLVRLFLRDLRSAQYLIVCLCVGTLTIEVLGLFDYYALINLKFARPENFEQIYGETYRFQRLVSVFGNPSWTSQFLTLAAPAMLGLIGLKIPRWSVLALLVISMIITEWCVILTYQRGAWLAYPMTLLVIWFSAYVIAGKESQGFRHSLKSSAIKILLTLPITVCVSLGAVAFVAQHQPEYRQSVAGFVERAQSIKDTNDRLAFWAPSYKIFLQHPVLGAGVDSYTVQYEKILMDSTHPCYHSDPYTETGRGSAHNLFFQTMAGKGVLGVLSLIGLISAFVCLAWRGVFAKNEFQGEICSGPQKILLMAGFAYVCALVIYSNVGEIFYFPASYMLLALFAAVTAASGQNFFRLSIKFRLATLLALFIALGLHWYFEQVLKIIC